MNRGGLPTIPGSSSLPGVPNPDNLPLQPHQTLMTGTVHGPILAKVAHFSLALTGLCTSRQRRCIQGYLNFRLHLPEETASSTHDGKGVDSCLLSRQQAACQHASCAYRGPWIRFGPDANHDAFLLNVKRAYEALNDGHDPRAYGQGNKIKYMPVRYRGRARRRTATGNG